MVMSVVGYDPPLVNLSLVKKRFLHFTLNKLRLRLSQSDGKTVFKIEKYYVPLLAQSDLIKRLLLKIEIMS